jgi:outer membrane protein insertion porin family
MRAFLICTLLLLFFYPTHSAANVRADFNIYSISFSGNHYYSANQLLSALLEKKGTVFSESVLSADIARLLDMYKEKAYLHVRIDSVEFIKDTLKNDIQILIFLNEGKPSVVRKIEFDGCMNLSSAELHSIMQIQEGELLIPHVLEQDIQSILKRYESKGYPLTKISVKSIVFDDTAEEMSASIYLGIDEGKALRITEMRIDGNRSTKDNVIIREARLNANESFNDELLERIKRRLEHLQLFSSVSLPELYLTETEQAGLLVRVVEGNQNIFDGVLGYVPSSGTNSSGYITGLVNISLRNLFGTGRKLSARWYQENKSSQEIELHYFEPWVASFPVNLQLGFFQRRQDSTFVRLQYDLAAELMATEEFSLGISFSQNGVYPTKGYGTLVMPESRTTSLGAYVKYDSRDNVVTPASGILYITEYQTGSKRTSVSEYFPLASRNSTHRIVFDLSYYLSTFVHQVVAAELHIREFKSGSMDMSDLFRLGGASTLRGYREGQFIGSRLVWSNLEYRFLIAPRSFFYGFVDAGYLVRPAIEKIQMTSSEQSKIGYGIGVRLDSALGLIGVSFAFGEGDTFSTSKIHIRLMNEF